MSLSNAAITVLKDNNYTLNGDGRVPDIEGDLCDLYHCTHLLPEAPVVEAPEPVNVWDRLMGPADGEPDDPRAVKAFVKTPKFALNSDLIQQEARILQYLQRNDVEETRFLRYLPQLMFAYKVNDQPFHIVKEAVGYVTLEEVMRAYPDGLDYRDAAWMLKRVLSGIGYAHELGVIHGALVPSNILVHPTTHGAKIIDWSYSVKVRDRMSIRAYVAAYKENYPPEVFKKRLPTPATDLYMIGRLFQKLLGDVPGEIWYFLEAFTQEKPTDRPQTPAWALHDTFDSILRKHAGPPKYRPLAVT